MLTFRTPEPRHLDRSHSDVLHQPAQLGISSPSVVCSTGSLTDALKVVFFAKAGISGSLGPDWPGARPGIPRGAGCTAASAHAGEEKLGEKWPGGLWCFGSFLWSFAPMVLWPLGSFLESNSAGTDFWAKGSKPPLINEVSGGGRGSSVQSCSVPTPQVATIAMVASKTSSRLEGHQANQSSIGQIGVCVWARAFA